MGKEIFGVKEPDVFENFLRRDLMEKERKEAQGKIDNFSGIVGQLSIPAEKDLLKIPEEDAKTFYNLGNQLIPILSSITVFLDAYPEYNFTSKTRTYSSKEILSFIDSITKTNSIVKIIIENYKSTSKYSEQEKEEVFSSLFPKLQENLQYPAGSFDTYVKMLKDILDGKLVQTIPL